MTIDQHDSLDLQADIKAIVREWPDLEEALARGGSADRSGVRTVPGSQVPIDPNVSDLLAEIESWALFLARVLIDEIDWRPPRPATALSILSDIALAHFGHFSEHQDEALALSIAEDARRLRKRVRAITDPSKRRRFRLGIACTEHGTSDMGERVPCTGQYETMLDPTGLVHDMVCNRDPEHRMTLLDWQRSQRRNPLDPTHAAELIRAITRRHMTLTTDAS